MPRASDTVAKDAGFSAAKMFAELSVGPPRVLIGAVKSSETNPKIVMLCKEMNCVNWIEIPESMIDRYEYVGRVSCTDHDHPVVKLYLTAPQTSSEKAYLMADVPALQPARPLPQAVAANFTTASLSPLGEWYPRKGPCLTDLWGRPVYPDGTFPCP